MAKKPKTPKPPAKPKAGTMPAVRVRMYRQGLGDCFLLTFNPGGQERHVLIDCGTLGSTTTGIKLGDVVKDIRTTTGDHLHLLIATHEHWDHVRAFNDQLTEFQKIRVDHVWLAWTENPEDTLAQQIAKRQDDLGAALVHAVKALDKSVSQRSKDVGFAVRDILGFFGDDNLGADKFSESVNDAMNFVRTGTAGKVRFCKPGDGPFEEDWLPGFRWHVLGPPRDEGKLSDTGEKGSSELYGLAAGLRTGASLLLSGLPTDVYADGAGVAERAAFFGTMPFDSRCRTDWNDQRSRNDLTKAYFEPEQAWRRVDDDWLHVAPDLALQLDNVTNNTSLAIAIERISDGKVLLFPADAQQGNWLSWDANELLSRTVFYKVGHHASHNATAKGAGLELMAQEHELTAFIPVDRKVALGRNPPGSWKMPALKLYRRLLEKCEGRVLRSDVGWADDAVNATNPDVEKEFTGMATAAEWKKWRASQQKATHVTIATSFVDYELK